MRLQILWAFFVGCFAFTGEAVACIVEGTIGCGDVAAISLVGDDSSSYCSGAITGGLDASVVFQASEGQRVIMVTESSTAEANLELFVTQSRCDASTCSALSSEVGSDEFVNFVADGTEYIVTLEDKNSVSGEVESVLSVACPAACDPVFDIAEDVSCSLDASTPLTGTTIDADNVLQYYDCGDPYSKIVQNGSEAIYRFSPQVSGQVTLRLAKLTADHDIYVLEDICDQAACVASSTDVSAGSDSLTFTADSRKTYYIVIEAFETEGTFDLYFDQAAGTGCPEDCDNDLDDDLDGQIDCLDVDCQAEVVCGCDDDEDGYLDVSCGGTDCLDEYVDMAIAAATFVGSAATDGSSDCSTDVDNDGYAWNWFGTSRPSSVDAGADCVDFGTLASDTGEVAAGVIHPAAMEICGDDIDNDCDITEDGIDTNAFGSNNFDEDGDGLSDTEERSFQTDMCERDTDADGLFDKVEVTTGTSPTDADSDDDGLTDGDEVNGEGLIRSAGYGLTDPLDPDSDGDGLIDGLEVSNPVATGVAGGVSDGPRPSKRVVYLGTDTSASSWSHDLDLLTSTDPNNADTDGDALCDGPADIPGVCQQGFVGGMFGGGGEDENATGAQEEGETDPLDDDSDDDGLSDGEEELLVCHSPGDSGDPEACTDPLDEDSDADTVPDGDEVFQVWPVFGGTSGTVESPADTDGDGLINALDGDDDDDGYLTINEDPNGNGNPLDDDTNGDGIFDFLDPQSPGAVVDPGTGGDSGTGGESSAGGDPTSGGATGSGGGTSNGAQTGTGGYENMGGELNQGGEGGSSDKEPPPGKGAPADGDDSSTGGDSFADGKPEGDGSKGDGAESDGSESEDGAVDGDDGTDFPGGPGEGEGCGCRHAGKSSSGFFGYFGLLAAVAWRRRRSLSFSFSSRG